MAVVNFQRSGDAAEARRQYNGKIIDGRKFRLAVRLGKPVIFPDQDDLSRLS